MSQYRPSMANLIETVGQFLDDLAPTLKGELKYKANVSSYLLAICRRELADQGAENAADLATWRQLLGTSAGDPAQARRDLCERIRHRDFDDRFDELLTVLLERTASEVRIVRPEHLKAQA